MPMMKLTQVFAEDEFSMMREVWLNTDEIFRASEHPISTSRFVTSIDLRGYHEAPSHRRHMFVKEAPEDIAEFHNGWRRG